MIKDIKIIGFDADDTLWDNEIFFRQAEKEFVELMKDYNNANALDKLIEIEVKNISLYGYGIKSFTLSMIEAALDVSKNEVTSFEIAEILDIGKRMLNKPVTLIDGIEKVLKKLSQSYQLIIATKGDLLDQKRKLQKSGLAKYFHHIEIMIEKSEDEYSQLLDKLNVDNNQFLMIGNSLKSDILPLLNLGTYTVFVPYKTTWVHEMVHEKPVSNKFFEVSKVSEVLSLVSL